MPKLIAKIVGSNSHVDYLARVIDKLDSNEPPDPADFAFSTFVHIPVGGDNDLVGIVYNSMLMNPDYANYGPRLSPSPELGSFSPDFINEQGCLIGILLLGSVGDAEGATQGVPASTVEAGREVFRCDEDLVKRFHTNGKGEINMQYYSQVISHAGKFAAPLLESIIEGLSKDCEKEDRKRLTLLKQNLAWQRTIGATRP